MSCPTPVEPIAEPKVWRHLPPWFKQPIADPAKISQMKSMFRQGRLHTVCESAHCPNMGQCWGQGVATFMILGEVCTRACRFCAIRAGNPSELDREEPQSVAMAVKELNLRYVVVTSVARDDLQDEGAWHFSQTIKAIRQLMPQTKIEVLIPDLSNRLELLEIIAQAQPQVISHNIETVKRLSPIVRPQADYQRSLSVLRNFKILNPQQLTKSSLMLGLGETFAEVKEVLVDLRGQGCDILTIGQYLSPSKTKRHLPVKEYITPQQFKEYEQTALSLGFAHVMSGPLVRSSYIAEQGYLGCLEKYGSH